MKAKKYAIHLMTIVCLLVLVTVLSPKAHALSGKGTAEDPYVISTAADLSAMHNNLSAHYALGADINMTGVSYTPVGSALEGPFTGSLDGRGHTISNLMLNLGDTKFVGLFGYLEGSVTDVKLAYVNIIGGRYVGGIAGNAGVGSSITNCHVLSGTISSSGAQISTNVGGITGLCEGEISACSNAANVTAKGLSNPAYAGGMAGYYATVGVELKNCVNSGVIAAYGGGASDCAGGMAGYCESALSIEKCTNSGQVIADYDSTGSYAVKIYAGGMFGYTKSAVNMTDCTNRGSVLRSQYSYYGGCLGGMIGYSNSNIILVSCENSGNLQHKGSYSSSSYSAFVGGMVGYGNAKSLLTDCKNTGYIYCYAGYSCGMLYAASASSNSVLSSCTNRGEVCGYSRTYPLAYNATIIENSSSCICYVYLYDKSIELGQSASLQFSLNPSTGYDDSVTWTSSDESIATVDQSGVVTGRGVGTTTITATTAELGLTATCTVTVASALTLDQTSLTIERGFTAQLTPVRTPEISDTYTWSTNSSVATVSSNGVVTACSTGTATITVTSSSGLTATCTVKVIAPTVVATGVSLNQSILRPVPGEKVQLTATVSPTGATDKTLTWESSDPAVATVSASGVVEALTPGEALITVRTANGLYDTCQVKVVQLSNAAFVVSNSRGTVDSSFETTVQLVKNPGIAAFTLAVQYDSAAMTPVSVTADELLKNGTLSYNAENGVLHVTWYSAQDAQGDGLAFTITWQAVSSGSYPITLSFGDDDVCNAEKDSVRMGSEGGTAQILDRAVGDIYYDGAVNMKDIVYLARYFNGQETLDDKQTLAADLFYDGVINVKDLEELAQILSQSLPDAEPVAMSLMSMEDEPFVLAVGSVQVKTGESASVNISGANCGGVASMRFRINVPEGVEVLSVQPTELLENSGTFRYNEETGIVTWYSDTDQELNGDLVVITLRTDKSGNLNFPIALDYSQRDFCSSEDYQDVTLEVCSGELSLAYAQISKAKQVEDDLIITVETNRADWAKIYCAVYQDGKMSRVFTTAVPINGGEVVLPVKLGSGEVCKVFLLDGDDFTPLAEAITVVP